MVYDLAVASTGPGNGEFIKIALTTCASVADFERLLDSTNISGRRTRANFAVMDSSGVAKMIETGGNAYWVFDASSAPNGYVIRSNFSMMGKGFDGMERYNRSVKLISDFYAGDSLNFRSVFRTQMRDFSGFFSAPYPVPTQYSPYPNVPEWYFLPGLSICNMISISATVIHGVLAEEPAKLTTMWNVIGQPATSVAVPYWPVGNVPDESNGAVECALSDIAEKIRSELFNTYYVAEYGMSLGFINTFALRDTNGVGLWSTIFPVEDSIFTRAEDAMGIWREEESLNMNEMLLVESSLAKYALSALNNAYYELTGIVALDQNITALPVSHVLDQNYPNPFNPTTTISYSLAEISDVSLSIFDVQGRTVARITESQQSAGNYNIQWNGTNEQGLGVPTGVYLARLEAGSYNETIKMVFLR